MVATLVCVHCRDLYAQGLGMLLATATATAPDVVTAVRQSLLLGTSCQSCFLHLQVCSCALAFMPK